jgi:hypothetical protein
VKIFKKILGEKLYWKIRGVKGHTIEEYRNTGLLYYPYVPLHVCKKINWFHHKILNIKFKIKNIP